MTTSRYVTLGAARVRAPWFTEVARWSTSGQLAMDFVKTVSAEEVRSRLRSGRRFSALLVDAGLLGVDRDLLQLAAEHHCAAIVVTDDDHRDWVSLGAVAVLPSDFGPLELEAILEDWATPVSHPTEVPGQVLPPLRLEGHRARTVTVAGPGGTGSSTVAIAVAQGMAADVSHAHTVLLADLALHADQGMLHDAGDVIPGVLELVEAHRAGSPSIDTVRALTFDIVDRRYRLLLGLRQHRDWTAIRPRALEAAVDRLRQAFSLVIFDIEADLEGAARTGSSDVEERNAFARVAVELADVVVAVGAPGMKGTHSLLRVVNDLLDAGVAAERIVPVINRAPRRGRARAELMRSMIDLLDVSRPGQTLLSPVFVPDRRGLDEALRDGALLPAPVVDPVTVAVRSRLDAVSEGGTAGPLMQEPVPVTPGSLGSWSEEVG